MVIEEASLDEEKRLFKRKRINLKTIVQIRFNESELWKETAELNTVSKNGADFDLSRECTIGRLIMLLMPMPVELRLYDESEELYPVVALVQNCHEFKDGDTSRFHVGVAFTGKVIPDSYRINPLQTYHISGVRHDGSWNVVESEKAFKTRKHRRVWKKIEVAATLIQRERHAITKELVHTRDISEGGASVWCTLETNVGDRIKFACKEYNFYSIAVVRNIVENNDAKRTIHLEFVDTKFPMHKLHGSAQPDPVDD